MDGKHLTYLILQNKGPNFPFYIQIYTRLQTNICQYLFTYFQNFE